MTLPSSSLSILKAFETKLSKTNWDDLFESLAQEEQLTTTSLSTSVARSEINRKYNRWFNILPYNHSRIVLKDKSVGSGGYINASAVNAHGRYYILCQGPLDITVTDFWSMVWQERVKTIVMLCKTIENGIEKCVPYWPLYPGDVIGTRSDKYQVSFKSIEEKTNYRLRLLSIAHFKEKEKEEENGDDESKSQREIRHFHFTTWPDFGVPRDYNAFLDFILAVNGESTADSPIVVHCSAGIGRSGTYILVDSCLNKFRKTHSLKFEEVQQTLLHMRKHRQGLIQTEKQLQFSFYAIYEGMKRELSGRFGGISKKRSQSEEPDSRNDGSKKRQRNLVSEGGDEKQEC